MRQGNRLGGQQWVIEIVKRRMRQMEEKIAAIDIKLDDVVSSA